jgi:hypothetical protein
MPLVSSSIPNLINGVSQQPPALRLASQAEQVVNCMPSPVEGLKKRPPCQHIAKLFSGSAGTGRPFVHIVDRDGAIQYLVLIQDNNIRVFGLDGSVKTVNTPDGTSYLDITGEPSSTFRVATVADTTSRIASPMSGSVSGVSSFGGSASIGAGAATTIATGGSNIGAALSSMPPPVVTVKDIEIAQKRVSVQDKLNRAR